MNQRVDVDLINVPVVLERDTYDLLRRIAGKKQTSVVQELAGAIQQYVQVESKKMNLGSQKLITED